MKNSSYVKVIAALAVMSVYIFMFGIVGKVGKDGTPNTDGILLDTADMLAEESEPDTLTDSEDPLRSPSVPPTDTEMRLPTYIDYVNPLPGTAFDELRFIGTPNRSPAQQSVKFSSGEVRTGGDLTGAVKEKSTPKAVATTRPQRAPERTSPATTATTAVTITAATAERANLFEEAETIPPRRESRESEPASYDDYNYDDQEEFSDIDVSDDDDEPSPLENDTDELSSSEVMTVQTSGGTVKGDAYDIISRMVEREMGASFSVEALKAQAVAAYSYVRFANDTGVKPSVAISEAASDKVKEAVRSVFGQAVYKDGKIIQAMYSASSAGYSASAVNVWGIDVPYLRSVQTDFDKQFDPNWGLKKSFSSAEISRRVKDVTGIELEGDPADWLKVLTYVDKVYVGKMEIGGGQSYISKITGDKVTLTGRVFREGIMDFDLRSAAFTYNYDSGTDTFYFVTFGFGHGVGMSQNGANILAKNYGYTYDRILKFYYGGVSVG